jgi:hypothetical protein
VTGATAPTGAAVFVERFSAAWDEPEIERFQAILHPEIVLEQPLMPRMEGKAQAREGFSRLLDGLPGLRGKVLSWTGTEELLFIELKLETGGRRPFEWTMIDRIELEDGLVRERISFFDPLPVILAALTRPSWWPKLARLRQQR